MNASDLMTRNPSCCTPDTSLQEVAKMMVDNDCGEIPVLDENRKPIGVVTDRDIAVRTVARGKNPLQLSAKDAWTTPCITVKESADLDDCIDLFEQHQIRRLVVVDDDGICIGMISQADLARQAEDEDVGELVREVSRPSEEASRLH